MTDKDIIAVAVARMREAIDADKLNREEALDDMQAIAGRIWPEAVKDEREAANRAVITINRHPQFVRQVTGDIRRLNPAIKVIPADGEATDKTAEVIEGLIREIEYSSDAASIYEGACEHAAMCGMGAFRVLHDYEADDSFDQVLKIEPISNPFSVYWDPKSRRPTREDADYCFITEEMGVDDFKAAYPDKSVVDAEYDGNTDGLQDWHSDGRIVVAEYFWKEPVERKIALTMDGRVLTDPEQIKAALVFKERTVKTHKVMWAKVTGLDVIEGPKEWPGRYIPVIAVMGEEIPVGDEVVRTSVIRWAKDPVRLYSYYASTMAEVVALQPKAPYLVTAKQVAGQETNWGAAGSENLPYLIYNPDDKAPPPQRVPPPMPSSGIISELARAENDMKATTGIYDAGLGSRSNETSGVAIAQRQLESDISVSIYADNLQKSIRHCAQIIIDMIPAIYDAPRLLRVIGPDDEEVKLPVNDIQVDPLTGQAVEGIMLGRGRYSVKVSVGPNYSTRRQEVAASMMQFVQALPQAGAVAADLIAKAMDWPDADKLAERLKAALPPTVVGGDQDPMAAQAAQAQMQMQAQAAQVQLRKAAAEAAEAEADAAKAQAEAQKAAIELRALIGGAPSMGILPA